MGKICDEKSICEVVCNDPNLEIEEGSFNDVMENERVIAELKGPYAPIPLEETVDIKKFLRPSIPRRYLVLLLTFFGLICACSLRLNLSIAIVAMTKEHSVIQDNGTIVRVKEFNWTSKEKGFILSSFYYGFAISEFPSGYLAGRFGGATVWLIQVICVSLTAFIIPFAVYYGPVALFTFRTLSGLFEGGLIPCVHTIWSRWAPEEEKSTLIATSLSGLSVTNLIFFPLYGFMATHIGWRSLFYIPGGMALFWCVLWYMNVTNDPATDKKITTAELKYIKKSKTKFNGKGNYPWRRILTSVPVWTIIITDFLCTWGYLFLLSELPSFFNDVWQINLDTSGTLISIPYFAFSCGGTLSGFVADYFISVKGYPVWKVRRTIHFIHGLGGSLCLFLMLHASNLTMAIILLTASCGFYSLLFGTLFCSPLDIAPNYAGVIVGLATSVSSVAGILSTTLCGYIVQNQKKEEWQIAFYTCVGAWILNAVVYVSFGSGKLQSWAHTVDS